MQPERIPLAKVFDVPFISLDGTSVEMASLLFLFLVVVGISRVGRYRQTVRRLVQLASIAVFFFVVYSCLGVFGMIRNSLYGLTLVGSAYTEAFYWIALPLVVVSVTVISGPVFCGWICPTGTLQDLAGLVRTRALKARFLKSRLGAHPTPIELTLWGITLAGFVALCVWVSAKKQMFLEDSSLHWAACLVLLCFLVLAGIIEDLPTRRLRLVSLAAIFVTAVSRLVITSPVHFAFTSRNDPASALATLVIMMASLFVLRAWCRYLCPWGYLMGLLHPFSRLTVARDNSLCTDCQTCARVCYPGAIDKEGFRGEHCQLCYACVDRCPTGALRVVDEWEARRNSR
ncbi:MAG: 4Fe-4S binding protein [Pseudomonadota bacterium]